MKSKYFILFAFLFVNVSLYAQLDSLEAAVEHFVGSDSVESSSFLVQPKRIEFEVGPKDENFNIVSADKDGLLVVKQTRIHLNEGYLWEFYMLDSLFEEKWHKKVSIKYGSTYLGYDRAGDSFFILFGTAQYKKDEMRVEELALQDGSLTSHDVKTSLAMELSHFEVVGRSLIFGGYSNARPIISLFNLVSRKNKVMPGFYNTNSQILNIQTDDALNNFTVLSTERTVNKHTTIAISTFTEYGEQVHTQLLKSELDKSLVDGMSTNFDNGTQYISGTFSKRKSDYSLGVYLTKLNLGRQDFIEYHDYSDLENVFSYMKANREERVKEKIERKKTKGKKMKLNYRLLINQIIQNNDEIILIGEAYYPKYSNYGASGYLEPSQHFDDSNFIGYNYTHAIVVGFSKQGKLLWDNSFEINDVLSYRLKKNIQISVEEEKIVLLYVFDNVIKSKIIMNDEILEGKTFDPLELKFKSDEIKDHEKEMEGLVKWYDNNFYSFGIHRIKNLQDQDVKLNRKVFYINKIQYQ